MPEPAPPVPARAVDVRILIAEDDEDLAFVLREALARQAYEAEVVGTAEGLFERLKAAAWDLILLDVKLPDMNGLEAIARCRELAPDSPIIVMTAYGTRQVATTAIMRGAYDYFTKPLKMAEFQVVVARALERRRLQQQVRALQTDEVTGFEDLVGGSEVFTRVLDLARRAAPTDLTILIEGESGTGKERLARAIHRRSTRSDGPFVAVSCSGVPDEVIESELFGHERGAISGAPRAKAGRIELARGGTLFLDEIGGLSMAMQAKVLRTLQEREFERVGGIRRIGADVRVIAATDQDLDRLASQGKFRPDLFYRLQGVRLRLPALRERIEDLPALASHILAEAGQRLGKPNAAVSPEALRCLWAYGWPGNIRELQHVLEGALLLSDGLVQPEHLPPGIRASAEAGPAEPSLAYSGSLDDALGDWERRMLLDALRRANWIQAKAARILGISERSFWYRMKKHKIPPRTEPE